MFAFDLQVFETQIAAFQQAGNGIVSEQAEAGGAAILPTCERYMEQQQRIADLISLYKSLVQKDAEDLRAMRATLVQWDTGIAGRFAR